MHVSFCAKKRMEFLNNSLNDQVEQVFLVCPDVSKYDIRRDLSVTSSAEQTINRIFDGNFLNGVVEEELQEKIQYVESTRITDYGVDLSDDDDLNDLPEVELHQYNSNFSAKKLKRSFTDREDVAGKAAKTDRLSGRIAVDLTENFNINVEPQKCHNNHPDKPPHIPSSANNLLQRKKDKHSYTASESIDLTTNQPSTMNTFDKIDHRGSPISLSSSDDESNNTISLLNRIRGRGESSKVVENNNEAKTNFGDDELSIESVSNINRYQTNYDGFHSYKNTGSLTSDSQETLASVSSTISSVSCDSSSSSKARKAARSPEEIAEHKRLALERKAQKEKERQEKKVDKAKQQQQRKALQELKKSSRPEECMKYITAMIDPVLLEASGGGEVLAKLQSLECKTELRAQPMLNTISWKRGNVEHRLGEDLQMQSFTTQTDEEDVLIVIPTSEFVEMISNYQKEQSSGYCEDDHLRSFAQKAKKSFKGKTITMVTIAMEKYFRHQKTLQNRNFRAACLGADATQPTKKKKIKKVEDIMTSVTRLEVEEALVDLQLQEGCVLKLIETATELGDLVAMYTKAVAETPFKRERDKATFSFHVDTEWAGGVKIGKDGKGLIRLWRQQIQQFRNVSPEIAQAVVAEYPSPQLLLQAYSQCSSSKEAEKLLEDIMVRRGTGVLSRSRRVGKELSRRVYIQMTSRDSNQILH